MDFFSTREVGFPSQKKSFNAKDKQWFKNCIDAAEGLAIHRNDGLRVSHRNKRINYDLYSDILDQSDVERICNPLGVIGLEAPAKIQNYPVCNPKIDLLVGESTKRRFDWKVRVLNDEAISQKEEALKQRFAEMLASHLEPNVPDNQKVEDLRAFNQFMNYEYQDLRERRATHVLKYLYSHLKLDYQFAKGFKDALICAEEIYQADIVGGEPVFRRLNPLNVHIVRSGESPYIEDADIILIRGYMSPGQIIDEYHDFLSPTDVSRIEGGFNDASESRSSIDIGRKPDLAIHVDDAIDLAILENDLEYGSPFDNNGNILVSKVYWKSLRKVKKLKYYDEQGDVQYDLVDENYKPDKTKGEETEILWISEWMEGHKIGGSRGYTADDNQCIYLRMRPRPIQFRKMENPSRCHPGIIGTIYNTNDNIGVSLMDRMKPYQYMYNILAYNTELSIATNYGKIMRLGLHEIPEGWQIDKWLSFAQGMKIAPYDAFKEGNKGASQGKLAGAMPPQAPVIDMEMGNTIQLYMNMMQFIKYEMGEIAGVSQARQGQIETREAVHNAEREITQSSHITEYWFAEHEQVKLRSLEILLDTAKIAWRNKKNKKVQHVLDDGSTVMFEIDDQFLESEYGLQITNGADTYELMENLKQLAHAGIQNQMITFSQLMDIYTTDSVASIRRKLQRAEQQSMERAQQAEEAQRTHEQQLAQMQGEEMDKARDHEKAEWDREDARNTEDNETKLTIAQMQLNAKAFDHEDNGENISIRDLQKQAADIRQKDAQIAETIRHNKKTEEQGDKKLEIDKKKAEKPAPKPASK